MGFILIPGSLVREKLLDIKPIPLPFQFIPFPPPCLLWDLEHCLAALPRPLLKNLFQQFFNHTSFNRTESFQIS